MRGTAKVSAILPGPTPGTNPSNRLWLILSWLFLSCLTFNAHAVTAPAEGGGETIIESPSISARIQDGHSGQPLASVRVWLYERLEDGNAAYVSNQYTSADGTVSFLAEGLGSGRVYFLKSRPYNGRDAYSSDINTPGDFVFKVGTLQVRAFGNVSGKIMAGVPLQLRKVDGTGKDTHVSTFYTDAEGFARFTPHFVGGDSFYIRGRSELTNQWRRTRNFTAPEVADIQIGNDPIYVSLFDGVDGTLLPGKRVYAYELQADGSKKSSGWRTTDDNGVASFDLDQNGLPFVFRTKIYESGWSYSESFDGPGEFNFPVGTLRMTLISNLDKTSMPGKRVYLYQELSDGSLKWAASGRTNENGIIRFTPNGLGGDDGAVYVAKAKSPINGRWQYSQSFTEGGAVEFQAGNDPTAVRVRDALTGELAKSTRVYSYQVQDDGSLKGSGWAATGEDGVALFDLPFDGKPYLFKTKIYSNWAYTSHIAEPGEHELAVGTLALTLLSNIDGKPMAGEPVYLYHREANGESKYVGRANTDLNGLVKFSPRGLGTEEGAAFFAKVRSPVNRQWRYSQDFSDIGAYEVMSGHEPVVVTVVDALSKQAMPGLKVYLVERMEDGKEKWRASTTSDDTGQALFDTDGVGEKDYFLKTKVFGTGWAYSRDIVAVGEFEFPVGTLEVKLIGNLDQQPLPQARVDLYEVVAGETSPKWRARGNTDAEGSIRFTPYGLGTSDRQYMVRMKSQVNNQWRYSDPITRPGSYTIQSGNDPLYVNVINGISGNPVAGLRVDVLEELENGDIRRVSRGNSNDAGQIIFDINSLGGGNAFRLKANPYGAGWTYSDEFKEPGTVDFQVGTLELTLKSNIDQTLMKDKRVYLYQRIDAENSEYVGSAYSDESGKVRFTPMGLGQGNAFYAKAKSPVNNRWRYSEEYRAKGAFDFTVGFDPVFVSLVNGVSGAPLPNTKIYAIEQLPNGEKVWRYNAYTNDLGALTFDLPGFETGSTYQLYTKPYNAGGVYSDTVKTPGEFRFRVGRSPVTLIDGDTNSPIAGTSITAYRKLPNGDLQWHKRANTDSTGTIHFDLEFVDGQPFVFYARNLFGQNKRYYSSLVNAEGPVQWIVTADGDNTLDLTPPEINFTSPIDGDNVTENGFTATGIAMDNRAIESVSLALQNGTVITEMAARFDALSSAWMVDVPGSLFVEGDSLILTATATDRAQNESTQSIAVNVVADTEGPVISITSHADGDDVAVTGFLLSGSAADLTGVASMTATISDPVLGDTVKDITVAANGTWTVRVSNGEITEQQVINITLDALDVENNPGSAAVSLNVTAVDYANLQLINRITFGTTPALLAEVNSIGADSFVAQQLDPASMDIAPLQQILGADPTTTSELQAWTLLRMAYSPQQLLEVMTWFWDNHFNTDINTTRTDWEGNEVSNTVAFELAENQAFRANALGNFRTLLGISAKSPSMLIYLDSISNVAGDSNENYSREVMELSTLGVGNFTEADVEAGAQIFTGWHLDITSGQFVFNSAQHTDTMPDGSAPVILGNVITETGEAQGDQMLDILASHPDTANYICYKLVELFINDNPPVSAVGSCATTFQDAEGTDDQMAQVLTTIFSNEFFDPANYRAKLKTPVEFVIGALRNLQGISNGEDLAGALQSLGLRLYLNPVPTGYSEVGSDWINSGLLIERINWANDLSRNPVTAASSIDPVSFLQMNGYFTNEAIVDFLIEVMLGGEVSDLTRQQLLSVFGAYQMDLSSPAAGDDDLLRQLVGTLMSLPQYQFQ